MTILNTSPIPSMYEEELYLNDSSFIPKLFFTDTNTKLCYFIMRNDKVITQGVLQGHNNGTNYDYRFDFSNYIKIDNQETISLTGNSTNYQFNGNNSCELYFVYSTTDFTLVNTNISNGNLTLLSTGEVILTSGKTIDDIVCTEYGYFKFIDAIDSFNNILIGTAGKAYFGQFMPIISYTDEVKIRIQTTSLVSYVYMYKNTNYDYRGCLLFVPVDCQNIWIQFKVGSNYIDKYLLYPEQNCSTPYYFFNENGMFDAIYCEGTANEVDTITRTSLTVGKKQIQTGINIQKQIKHNTGFNITQSQMYSLMKSPLVYKLEGSILKEYVISNNSFDGYNGKKLSGKNIELILTDPVKYERKTNYTTTFFD